MANKDDDFLILSNLYERKYLTEDESLVLAEGFDDAIIGITTIYDLINITVNTK